METETNLCGNELKLTGIAINKIGKISKSVTLLKIRIC
jgi:hypothetical protein